MKVVSSLRNCLVIMLLLLAVGQCHTQDVPLRGKAKIHFNGYSNVHDFEADFFSKRFVANLKEKDGKSTLEIRQIEVPVLDINTGDEKRDETMYRMFGTNNFPSLTGSCSNVDLSTMKSGESEFPIQLKIRDTDSQVQAKVVSFKRNQNDIQLELEFPVSLKDFHLRAPSAMFGMVRVKDRVDVKVSLSLKESVLLRSSRS